MGALLRVPVAPRPVQDERSEAQLDEGARVERQLRADDEEPDRKPNGAESNTEQGEQAIVCKCLSTKAKWRKFGAFAIEGGLQ